MELHTLEAKLFKSKPYIYLFAFLKTASRSFEVFKRLQASTLTCPHLRIIHVERFNIQAYEGFWPRRTSDESPGEVGRLEPIIN